MKEDGGEGKRRCQIHYRFPLSNLSLAGEALKDVYKDMALVRDAMFAVEPSRRGLKPPPTASVHGPYAGP